MADNPPPRTPPTDTEFSVSGSAPFRRPCQHITGSSAGHEPRAARPRNTPYLRCRNPAICKDVTAMAFQKDAMRLRQPQVTMPLTCSKSQPAKPLKLQIRLPRIRILHSSGEPPHPNMELPFSTNAAAASFPLPRSKRAGLSLLSTSSWNEKMRLLERLSFDVLAEASHVSKELLLLPKT